jgi:hypothetical protein
MLNKAMEDVTCMNGTGILPFFPAEHKCNTLVPYADEAAMEDCNADGSIELPQEEVGIQQPIDSLPGCNPLFDGPGYPMSRPACPSTPPTARIGAVARLVDWWSHDPRLSPRKFAVFDGFNATASTTSIQSSPVKTTSSATKTSTSSATKTTTSTTTATTRAVVTPTGPSSGTIYMCTGQNWDGYCSNWSWKRDVCKELTSPLLVKILSPPKIPKESASSG